LASVDDVRIFRIWCGHPVFLDVDRVPVVERDAPIIRSTLHARAARILLSGTDAIGKRVVGGDVIHRRRVLVVPIAPAPSTIRGDHRSLIGDGKDDLRVVGIDPDALVVVPARRAAYRAPCEPAIERPPHHRRRRVDDLRILWIHGDGWQVAAADPRERPHVLRQARRRTRAAYHLEPMRATVRGLVKADRPLSRRDHGVEDVRIARGDRDVRLQNWRKSLAELRPGRSAVGRLEDSHPRVSESLTLDEALLLRPERCVDDIRIARVEQHFVGAGVVVLEQHLREGPSAIGGAKNAALGVRAVRVTEDCNEEPVGVAGIHGDRRNHLAVAQSEMLPGASGISGFVDPVADGKIRTDDARSGPDIDDVGVRRGDTDRANRAGRLVIEQRNPVGAVVRRSPEPAVVEPGIDRVRLAGDAG
jgi:hypothetical protein